MRLLCARAACLRSRRVRGGARVLSPLSLLWGCPYALAVAFAVPAVCEAPHAAGGFCYRAQALAHVGERAQVWRSLSYKALF